MKTNWLDRRIAAPGPHLALCLSEMEFRRTVQEGLNVQSCPRWVSHGANATTHTFNGEGAVCCIICLSGYQGRDPVEVAGLLVHEAVHVWQQYCDDIGEHNPGTEQEAYAIQFIAQELLAEFARRIRAMKD